MGQPELINEKWTKIVKKGLMDFLLINVMLILNATI